MVDVIDDVVSGDWLPALCIGDAWIIEELERLRRKKQEEEDARRPRVYLPVPGRENYSPDLPEPEGTDSGIIDSGDISKDFEVLVYNN